MLENYRISYATELPLGRKRSTNKRFHVSDRIEFEEIDGKIERKYFAIYFPIVFPAKFIPTRYIK